ncbi:MAG: aspartate/glutamate racemase family protein [Lachnospiraceae bacterium]
MNNNRPYGFLNPCNDGRYIENLPNQQVSGYSVGIVYIEQINYPLIPGNVVNAYTYDFPVRMRAVKNLTNTRLFNADPAIVDDIIEAAKSMVENEGVRAICSACGFFGNYHKQVVAALDVPVAMSSLVQVPLIQALLKPNKKIGILTANGAAMTQNLLNNCGITKTDNLVIKDALQTKEFAAVVDMRGHFDNEIARNEIVTLARQMVEENPEIGAILLECSDMPPYASSIQEAVKLPVFDFITLIKWLDNSSAQKPYSGFM